MDGELYERYRATVLFVGTAIVSVLLVVLPSSFLTRSLRAVLNLFTQPVHHVYRAAAPFVPSGAGVVPDSLDAALGTFASQSGPSRALQVLRADNQRLREQMALPQRRWPRAVAAEVIDRTPPRWFQEILLNKGAEQGLRVDDAVITGIDGQDVLVGRVLETGPDWARVMLLFDPLSVVPATAGTVPQEDGVVEGVNRYDLWLRFLSRDSRLKIGDLVRTSGLGKRFPEGLFIGWVQEIGPDPEQQFLQARVRSALAAHPLRLVLVLVSRG